MVSFDSLSQRMADGVRDLHDYLWAPKWNGNEIELQATLLTGAKELDDFLAAGGKLVKNAEALARDWGRGPTTEALFELLHHTYSLTAARELLKKGEYKSAAEKAVGVAESASIGVCAAAGCFPLVDEWERGGGDFETYTTKLAEELEDRGVRQGGDFCRVLLATGKLGRSWHEKASSETQALTAQTVVMNAAWCAAMAVTIREGLGATLPVPYRALPALVRHISRG